MPLSCSLSKIWYNFANSLTLFTKNAQQVALHNNRMVKTAEERRGRGAGQKERGNNMKA